MTQKISVEAINMLAPYVVRMNEQNGFLYFTSDYDVTFYVDFEEDDLITVGESYQLILANVNNKKSPRDEKVKQTVFVIVSQFLEEHQSALLYICETGDGKQRSRDRLFKSWISAYDYLHKFLFISTSIMDADGVENVAAMIVRNDNPKIVALVTEFTEVADLLRHKPDGEI